MYARQLAKEPNTFVLLVTPYKKLKDEALEDGVAIKNVEFPTVLLNMCAHGLLAVSSYEGVAAYRNALSSLKQKGVRLVFIFDEIHTILDSKQMEDGFRLGLGLGWV